MAPPMTNPGFFSVPNFVSPHSRRFREIVIVASILILLLIWFDYSYNYSEQANHGQRFSRKVNKVRADLEPVVDSVISSANNRLRNDPLFSRNAAGPSFVKKRSDADGEMENENQVKYKTELTDDGAEEPSAEAESKNTCTPCVCPTLAVREAAGPIGTNKDRKLNAESLHANANPVSGLTNLDDRDDDATIQEENNSSFDHDQSKVDQSIAEAISEPKKDKDETQPNEENDKANGESSNAEPGKLSGQQGDESKATLKQKTDATNGNPYAYLKKVQNENKQGVLSQKLHNKSVQTRNGPSIEMDTDRVERNVHRDQPATSLEARTQAEKVDHNGQSDTRENGVSSREFAKSVVNPNFGHSATQLETPKLDEQKSSDQNVAGNRNNVGEPEPLLKQRTKNVLDSSETGGQQDQSAVLQEPSDKKPVEAYEKSNAIGKDLTPNELEVEAPLKLKNNNKVESDQHKEQLHRKLERAANPAVNAA